MELKNKFDFEQVVHIMNIASIAKIKDCITSVEWSKEAVHTALNHSGFEIESILVVSQGDNLESLHVNCIVPFAAGEVPGIIVPFYCYVEAEVTLNRNTGKHEIHVFFGPKEMRGGRNYEDSYNVELLYFLFYSHNSAFDISMFVSDEFDFNHLCKVFRMKKLTISETSVPLSDET